MSPSRTGTHPLDDYSEAVQAPVEQGKKWERADSCWQARSFNNIANTNITDKDTKCASNGGRTALNLYGGMNGAFGFSNSIWSEGLPAHGSFSSGPSHDGLSRGLPLQGGAVDGKTGSGSLVDSSISEEAAKRSEWAKRGSATGRSIPNGRLAEHGLPQQRNMSNAGLGMVSDTHQSISRLGNRAPMPTNLNQTASIQPRQSYHSTFSGNQASRGADWPSGPVPVYTKLDRLPDAPYKNPDSAIDAWTDAVTTPSPSDERRPTLAHQYGRNVSMPTSRDASLPPSRGADEPPMFTQPDYSRHSQRATPKNSRAPSISSARNGSYNPYFNVHLDQTSSGQPGMDSQSRPSTSYRQNASYQGIGASTFRPHYQANTASNYRAEDRVEEEDRLAPTLAYNLAAQANGTMSSLSLAERYLQSGSVNEFRPGQPYRGNATTSRTYEPLTWSARLEDWQGFADDAPLRNRRSPAAMDASMWLDPRVQQQLYAFQVRNQFMANPYALQQLSPGYMQLLPAINTMNIGDPQAQPRDSPIGDGVQSALMYEFKSNTKAKRYELRDIYDHIAEFSGDQHGSRFIQTKLETANSDEKERVFREIEPNAIPLMTDVFGNYVIQKFFEHGDQTHKKILANKMKGKVLSLSLQMYGCRVVQKALDHVLVDQQAQLISELENYVLKCVKDQNGNHVIQKAIERCPADTIGFIIAAFQGQIQHLSIHPYGCRVVQRCLEKCDLPSKASIMMELMDGIQTMISDQFGNYVVQHIVAHDDGEAKDRVLGIVAQGLEGYSKHKFASNVVEKCLEKSDDHWRHHVAQQLVYTAQNRLGGEGVLLGMIKDNFGNYVIRK